MVRHRQTPGDNDAGAADSLTGALAMPPTVPHVFVLVADRRGGSATEYGMIAGILAIGIAGAFNTLAGKLSNTLSALNF